MAGHENRAAHEATDEFDGGFGGEVGKEVVF